MSYKKKLVRIGTIKIWNFESLNKKYFNIYSIDRSKTATNDDKNEEKINFTIKIND